MVTMYTWIPSISQRSPTSNGCIMNKNMIASNTVLQVFPKMNTTNRSWELIKTRKWEIGIPSIMSQIIRIMTLTRMLNILWSSSTAVFVSLRDNASALRSLNALTWTKGEESFFHCVLLTIEIHQEEKLLILTRQGRRLGLGFGSVDLVWPN